MGLVALLGSSVACRSNLDSSSSGPSATDPTLDSVAPAPATAPLSSAPDDTAVPAPLVDVPAESVQDVDRPVVIAHRGASGDRPENTLAAFALAIELGADYVEPDVVMTRDGHAIVRHDNVLDFTTDVADRAEFATKRTSKIVDGEMRTGWFSEDFTLEEIKTLRAVERNPEVRPGSARFDGDESVPTLREVLALVVDANEQRGLDVGVYPELKHPSHFASLGLDVAQVVVADLAEFGFTSAQDEALIQSFEVDALTALNEATDIRLVQLLGASGAPADQATKADGLTFEEMATPAGLRRVARYADGIAVAKNEYVIPLDESGGLDTGATTTFVADAHAAGLFVHVFTFRAENQFLPLEFRSAGGPNELGDVVGEVREFIRAGIDGFFIDHVEQGRDAAQAG